MQATKICVTSKFYWFFSGITGTKTSIVVVFISSVLFNIPRFFQWYSDSIPCAAGSKLYFRSPGALQSSDNVARKQVAVLLFVSLSACLWFSVPLSLSLLYLYVSQPFCLPTGVSSCDYYHYHATGSRGSRTLPGGCPNSQKCYYFSIFLPKTAWKWKNLDSQGDARPWRAPALGSANDWCLVTSHVGLPYSRPELSQDMFKRVHYDVRILGKRVVGIRLKCLLVACLSVVLSACFLFLSVCRFIYLPLTPYDDPFMKQFFITVYFEA